MLKPMDIQNMEFRTVWRGYDPEQVDEFTSRIFTEYETIYRENEELKATIAKLQEKLDHSTRMESSILEAVELAKETAESVRESAQLDAKAMIDAARQEAESIVMQARNEAETIQRRAREAVMETEDQVRQLERRQAELIRQMRAFIRQTQDALELLEGVETGRIRRVPSVGVGGFTSGIVPDAEIAASDDEA